MQSIMATRPAIFKWRQTEPGLILCAVRWYLRYSLSFRDVEELLEERGLKTDHTTVWRWVQCYAPELEQRLRGYLKPTNKSWRVDETYIRVKGRWCYLYLRSPYEHVSRPSSVSRSKLQHIHGNKGRFNGMLTTSQVETLGHFR
jgi:transposase, IS6 family